MSKQTWSIGFLEISLIQIILWVTLWLCYEYLASLLTVIFVPIFFSILLVSLIAELLEKSNISKAFFIHMLIAIVIPTSIASLVYVFYDGAFNWLNEI